MQKESIDVFVVADNIISPVGQTTDENFAALKQGVSGVKQHQPSSLSEQPFYAALLSDDQWLPGQDASYTKFEQLLIASVEDALKQTEVDPASERTIFIISSTKGNISLVETQGYTANLQNRVALHTSARLLGEYFKCPHQPLVVSNACISGILAILTGKRLIQSGQYDHAVVVGADVISKFVLSGFQSFQAVSDTFCKPFDAARNGINLGEAAATVVLSAFPTQGIRISVTGGSVSNDANHISGPSRTGEELYQAIQKALDESGITASDIDLVSAHGTATIYNDEMEALAISLAGLRQVPVNSLKGYYGHTLGAAGIIESIISMRSMKENLVIPSMGYSKTGVSKPLNVATSLHSAPINNCLKTASGFGGCNAAILYHKA